MFTEESKTAGHIVCISCGGDLIYAPGTQHLKCSYCGTENVISEADDEFEAIEYDFEEALKDMADAVEQEEQHAVKCSSCGATSTLAPNVTSSNCPFCDTALVVAKEATTKYIKPHCVLPFRVEKKAAHDKFGNWLNSLWFAPNDLKKLKGYEDKLKGIYLPNWTFDTNVYTSYRGERGDAYYETMTYSTVENGKNVMKTRQVRKIRWSFAVGSVKNEFDDIITPASQSVPLDKMLSIEPWDLKALQPYDERFLAGYQTEVYTTDLKNGFELAKEIIDQKIVSTIRADIGGDEQRIHERDSNFTDVSFKHILLPIYISAYQYKGKVYRFVVNGQTGKIVGERPYSVWKILFAVLGALALIGILMLVFGGAKN